MQSSAPARPAASAPVASTGNGGSKNGKAWKGSPMWLRIVWLVLLFAATALIIAMLALLYFGGPKESSYIDKSKEQAVFLTNGQVYFGHIKAVNKQYVDLQNIYYLNVNQQVQPNQTGSNSSSSSNSSNQSVSLVKLGCELHGPADEMIINRDQVTFWENLKDQGQVSKAIAQWIQQNPNGQQCSTSSSSSSSTKQ
ncbi:MAG TPA: hypothetical protein VJP80_07210 [Candidatus Saccharimonadales bacterium]|nr:hypothetical protein [Candidatus Saccharimonadales bacterium]